MVCDGCGTDFSGDVELFPKLVITRDERVARELADKEGDGKEEMLCITCWLKALQLCEKDALGMLLLGLMRKNRALEEELIRHQNKGAMNEIIEKMKEKQWVPKTTPIWKTSPPITYGDTLPPQPNQVWCSSKAWAQAASNISSQMSAGRENV